MYRTGGDTGCIQADGIGVDLVQLRFIVNNSSFFRSFAVSFSNKSSQIAKGTLFT